MNKRIRKSSIFAILCALLTALILLSACNFQVALKTGSIALQWGSLDGSKTVFPFDPALSAVHHYDIVFTGPEGQVETLEDVTGASAEKPYLPVGTWTIEVIAYNASDNVLGRGIASGEVKASSTTKITVKVMPSGEGTLEFTVTWKDNHLVKDTMKIEAALLPDGQSDYVPVTLQVEGQSALYSGKLGSGSYNVLVKLIDESSNVLWGKLETFHLYEDLSTKADFSILQSEMNSAPEKAPILTASDRSYDKIRLLWDEGSARSEKYVIERKTLDTNWEVLTSRQYKTLSYVDASLGVATKYFYRIRAENFFGTSSWSDTLEVSTLPLEKTGGLLAKNTVWTKDRIYKIETNLKIPTGLSLTIMPGTKIIVDSGKFIQVEGELVARGNADEQIVFGYESSGWSYIGFIDASVDAEFVNEQYQSGCILQNAIIMGGGRIGVEKSYPYIDSIVVSDTNQNNISISLNGEYEKKLRITNSTLINAMGWGITFTGHGTVIIDGNYISGNCGVFLSSGNKKGSSISKNDIQVQSRGIELSENVTADYNNDIKIFQNRIYSLGGGVNDYGIRLGGWELKNIKISENSITKKSIGIYIEGFYDWGVILLENNNIDNCMQGMNFSGNYFWDWNRPELKVVNNIIKDNSQYGILFDVNIMRPIQFIGNYIDNHESQYEIYIGGTLKKAGQVVLDLTDNYWSTNDIASIKARIWDSDKDFELGRVNIEPIAQLKAIIAKPTYPASGVALSNSAIDLGWSIVGRATTTKVQISTKSSFSPSVFEKDVTGSVLVLGEEPDISWLKDQTSFYWRIAAKNPDGTYSSWSEPQVFTISISVPSPVAPLDGETLYDDISPTISWVPSAAAKAYHLVVDDNIDFKTPYLDTKIVGSTTYEFSEDLAPGITYYWTISALDENDVESRASAVQTFVLPAAGIYVRLSPDLPGAQNLKISGPDKSALNMMVTFACNSQSAMDKYVWTLNGEKIVETYVPTVTFSTGAWPLGFYTIGVTGWKDMYSYSDSKAFQIGTTY